MNPKDPLTPCGSSRRSRRSPPKGMDVDQAGRCDTRVALALVGGAKPGNCQVENGDARRTAAVTLLG